MILPLYLITKHVNRLSPVTPYHIGVYAFRHILLTQLEYLGKGFRQRRGEHGSVEAEYLIGISRLHLNFTQGTRLPPIDHRLQGVIYLPHKLLYFSLKDHLFPLVRELNIRIVIVEYLQRILHWGHPINGDSVTRDELD